MAAGPRRPWLEPDPDGLRRWVYGKPAEARPTLGGVVSGVRWARR